MIENEFENLGEKKWRRQILMTNQYPEGRITHLKNKFAGWSPLPIEYAIKHTEGKLYEYYYEDEEFGEIVFTVDVVDGKLMLVPVNQKLSKNFIYQIPRLVYKE